MGRPRKADLSLEALEIALVDVQHVRRRPGLGDLALVGNAHHAEMDVIVVLVLKRLARHPGPRRALGQHLALRPRALGRLDDQEKRLKLRHPSPIDRIGNQGVFAEV